MSLVTNFLDRIEQDMNMAINYLTPPIPGDRRAYNPKELELLLKSVRRSRIKLDKVEDLLVGDYRRTI